MGSELKAFAIKLALLVAIAPLAGYYLLKFSDLVEVAWKTNNRKKEMGRFQHRFCDDRRIHRLAQIAIVSFCTFVLPQNALCFDFENAACDILSNVPMMDLELTQQKFEQVSEAICNSNDPIEEAKKFLNALLNQIGNSHRVYITLHDLCTIAGEQLNTLPLELQSDFVNFIHALNGDNECKETMHSNQPRYHLYWPWEWKWFGLNNHPKHKNIATRTNALDGLPGQLRPSTVIGGLEFLAGLAIGITCGGSVVDGLVAGGLVTDGLRRIADDGQTDFAEGLRRRQFNPDHP